MKGSGGEASTAFAHKMWMADIPRKRAGAHASPHLPPREFRSADSKGAGLRPSARFPSGETRVRHGRFERSPPPQGCSGRQKIRCSHLSFAGIPAETECRTPRSPAQQPAHWASDQKTGCPHRSTRSHRQDSPKPTGPRGRVWPGYTVKTHHSDNRPDRQCQAQLIAHQIPRAPMEETPVGKEPHEPGCSSRRGARGGNMTGYRNLKSKSWRSFSVCRLIRCGLTASEEWHAAEQASRTSHLFPYSAENPGQTARTRLTPERASASMDGLFHSCDTPFRSLLKTNSEC